MKSTNKVRIGKITIGGNTGVVLIAGPCVIEGREITLRTAARIQVIAERRKIPVIFKASYKKANRTSAGSFSGIGIVEALEILREVKETLGLPILTDVHSVAEVAAAAEVADVLQIPAFLCRQTELLQAAGLTEKVVNIKKGQFLAPQDVRHAIEKVKQVGNSKILITERGATFGYHDLVVDMRSFPMMRSFGAPVIFDATHSVQVPGGSEMQTGGNPEYIFPLARAATAVGIDGLFIETHPEPKKAKSDSATQLKLDRLEFLIKQVMAIDHLVKERLAVEE